MKSKEEKRKNAEKMKAKYRSLPLKEKIKLVKSRRGDSTKELSKLTSKLQEKSG